MPIQVPDQRSTYSKDFSQNLLARALMPLVAKIRAKEVDINQVWIWIWIACAVQVQIALLLQFHGLVELRNERVLLGEPGHRNTNTNANGSY